MARSSMGVLYLPDPMVEDPSSRRPSELLLDPQKGMTFNNFHKQPVGPAVVPTAYYVPTLKRSISSSSQINAYYALYQNYMYINLFFGHKMWERTFIIAATID